MVRVPSEAEVASVLPNLAPEEMVALRMRLTPKSIADHDSSISSVWPSSDHVGDTPIATNEMAVTRKWKTAGRRQQRVHTEPSAMKNAPAFADAASVLIGLVATVLIAWRWSVR